MTIRYGATGPDVGAIQQQLIECGYAVPPDEAGAQRFGIGSVTALRSFQAAHVGPDGHALAEDGVLGPASEWALAHPNGEGAGYIVPGWRCEPSDARAELVAVMQWAVGNIGEHEIPDGSNRGPKIDTWTGMAGQPDGVQGPPWCAYFVSNALKQCTSGSPFGGVFASALKIHDWARTQGRILGDVAMVAPMAGDIFVILRGDGHGHVGFIGARLGDGRVCTVEGNAANACRGMIRDRGQFTAIVRPLPLY